MRKAHSESQFDYKIYEELRELKKETRQDKLQDAMAHLMGGKTMEDDELDMSDLLEDDESNHFGSESDSD